ncbi:MAG: acyl carrier protein [Isosphaeraceae bacterium]
MERQQLRATLTELLEETTGERYPEVTEPQSLTEGLGLDSVDLFSLVVEMQNTFQIKIASEELVPVATVGDLLDLLQAKLAKGKGSSTSKVA